MQDCFFFLLLLSRTVTAENCSRDLAVNPYPQFQIVAAAKTGSTSMYSYLCDHPDIQCAARKKELNLLRGSNIKLKTKKDRLQGLEWYQSTGFGVPHKSEQNMKIKKITFEASVHYYHHKRALENLHGILPCSKIVWILRNPLPRALSEYMHQAVKSRTYPSFATILEKEVKAIQTCQGKNAELKLDFEHGFENTLFKCLARFKLKKYALSTGFYAYFIHAWLEKFPFDQNLFLDYDSFRRNPEETLQKLTQFLGVSPISNISLRWKYNKANTRDGRAVAIREKSLKLPAPIRAKTVEVLRPQVEKVYEYIGENLEWKLDKLS